MFGLFMAARIVGSMAGKRKPHGPQYVQPYKGPHKNVYNVTRFMTINVCLWFMAFLSIVALLGR
jgi:hypothetical protein